MEKKLDEHRTRKRWVCFAFPLEARNGAADGCVVAHDEAANYYSALFNKKLRFCYFSVN
jgi:hypothetical protein